MQRFGRFSQTLTELTEQIKSNFSHKNIKHIRKNTTTQEKPNDAMKSSGNGIGREAEEPKSSFKLIGKASC